MVLIPVAIEPSEIRKRKKKLEKLLNEKREALDYAEHTNEEKLKYNQVNENDGKNIYLQVPNSNTQAENKQIEQLKKSLNSVNGTEFCKSLQSIDEDKKDISHEDVLMKSYTSLSFIASMHSLKNIKEHGIRNDISEAKKMVLVNENKESTNEENKLFDLKILMNVLFLFFAISNFLTSLGFNAPYIYITDQAVSYGK